VSLASFASVFTVSDQDDESPWCFTLALRSWS